MLERSEARFHAWQLRQATLDLMGDKDSATQGRRILALEERTAKLGCLIRKKS